MIIILWITVSAETTFIRIQKLPKSQIFFSSLKIPKHSTQIQCALHCMEYDVCNVFTFNEHKSLCKFSNCVHPNYLNTTSIALGTQLLSYKKRGMEVNKQLARGKQCLVFSTFLQNQCYRQLLKDFQ